MEPWYKVVTPRKEVREGRSFNPSEFAIALEQVVAGTAPEDYRDPAKFFSRTYFTHALREHTALVLRRLVGETNNTVPVLSLITQFGGGKTHTLTTLYHLVRAGENAHKFEGIPSLLQAANISTMPQSRVAVFVGNAWDPQPMRETPWIDLARQLAGDAGVAALGSSATTVAPGTETLGRLFAVAGGSVLILFDEVLNFTNRHRDMADQFYSFLQNMTVAMTGTTHSSAVISLPRSQTEMTDLDFKWQEKYTKVVNRVAKDLIALDETEISEVIRRRLFENLGEEKRITQVARSFADWSFERRSQLPPEWTAVDTATTEKKAREFLYSRFAACYPFHPATLSVFQRKWQTLPQYQQTRGTLAMLAQWVSIVYREDFIEARKKPLIMLGDAPLHNPDMRSVVLGQVGEHRLGVAIETDIVGQLAHARALDVDTKAALVNIHRRVGTAIFFESSGGLAQKVAYLPELRFALGEPGIDTTSIDSAAAALGAKAFYIRQMAQGSYRIYYKATLKKVVSDRRAGLDAEKEVRPAVRELIRKEFERGKTASSVEIIFFPDDGNHVGDYPKLTIVVLAPSVEWNGDKDQQIQFAQWSRERNGTMRSYPGALVWCVCHRKRDIQVYVEEWLAWQRVKQELDNGTLGSDVDQSDDAEVQAQIKQAKQEAIEKVWATYRFLILDDPEATNGVKMVEMLGGSDGDTLSRRVIASLKTQGLLNDGIGAGYLSHKWPPALKASGEWPLVSLRQSFFNGALPRLIDPDAILKKSIIEFVERGEFGLATGQRQDGTYERLWFNEPIDSSEVVFEKDVYLIRKEQAEELTRPPEPPKPLDEGEQKTDREEPSGQVTTGTLFPTGEYEGEKKLVGKQKLRLSGSIPADSWSRLGASLLPKLRQQGQEVTVRVEFTITADGQAGEALSQELAQVLEDLGIANTLHIDTV